MCYFYHSHKITLLLLILSRLIPNGDSFRLLPTSIRYTPEIVQSHIVERTSGNFPIYPRFVPINSFLASTESPPKLLIYPQFVPINSFLASTESPPKLLIYPHFVQPPLLLPTRICFNKNVDLNNSSHIEDEKEKHFYLETQALIAKKMRERYNSLHRKRSDSMDMSISEKLKKNKGFYSANKNMEPEEDYDFDDEDDEDDDFDYEKREKLEKKLKDLSYYNRRQIDDFQKTYDNNRRSFPDNEKYTDYTSKKNKEDEDDYYTSKTLKSDNFEVIKKNSVNFSHIGGYDNIKKELYQIIDLLKNQTKYKDFNVRVPKGLILEGPPGNGKTLFAKAIAGEARTGFITVSGSEFQDKYVGVGAGRVRELFALAKKNTPCIIFIDEIDALGRKRSNDGELSGSERDNTLNQLLVGLDGFQQLSGVFVIGATNRIDLLDPALIRPGRIDKKIHIGFPDETTRRFITDLYIKGKPYDESIRIEDFIRETSGFSCAQIENILNEAMLNALRNDRVKFNHADVELTIDKQIVGWQPLEHDFTIDMINRISVHEMGHAIVGMCLPNHSKVSKVVINLHSPETPAYTVFENSVSNIFTRENLLEHLMVLLGGRIAEEVIYQTSVTTGAINDFQETQKLAEHMILHYGMGENFTIYSTLSEHHKNMVDDEIDHLIKRAYNLTEKILYQYRYRILYGSQLLQENKILYYEDLQNIINMK